MILQKKRIFLLAVLIGFGLTGCKTNEKSIKNPEILTIDQIWSGSAANYDILTAPPYQFVAYYDSAKYMTIAQRNLNDKVWIKKRLNSQVGWDAHNWITMALDKEGFIHVSGNMHCDSLIYFQSEKPFDVSSLKRKYHLIGNKEDTVTYPQFFDGPHGDLIFSYRTGISGKGNQIYDRYNPITKKWSRLLDTPLIDGEGKSNPYITGPIVGPDGYFHIIWVWRTNFDANANSNISYARSKDLTHWEKSDGSVQELPITITNCEIIDPIPIGHGLVNGNTKIGFDSQNRIIVSYHKYDSNGNIQIYNARKEKDVWKIYQTTDWNWRWDFGGWGSIINRIGLSEVSSEDNNLVQTIYVDTVGYQKFVINKENLKIVRQIEVKNNFPDSLRNLRGNLKLGSVHIMENTSDKYGTFVLRWETLKRNGDKGYDFIPEPQKLELYHYNK